MGRESTLTPLIEDQLGSDFVPHDLTHAGKARLQNRILLTSFYPDSYPFLGAGKKAWREVGKDLAIWGLLVSAGWFLSIYGTEPSVFQAYCPLPFSNDIAYHLYDNPEVQAAIQRDIKSGDPFDPTDNSNISNTFVQIPNKIIFSAESALSESTERIDDTSVNMVDDDTNRKLPSEIDDMVHNRRNTQGDEIKKYTDDKQSTADSGQAAGYSGTAYEILEPFGKRLRKAFQKGGWTEAATKPFVGIFSGPYFTPLLHDLLRLVQSSEPFSKNRQLEDSRGVTRANDKQDVPAGDSADSLSMNQTVIFGAVGTGPEILIPTCKYGNPWIWWPLVLLWNLSIRVFGYWQRKRELEALGAEADAHLKLVLNQADELFREEHRAFWTQVIEPGWHSGVGGQQNSDKTRYLPADSVDAVVQRVASAIRTGDYENVQEYREPLHRLLTMMATAIQDEKSGTNGHPSAGDPRDYRAQLQTRYRILIALCRKLEIESRKMGRNENRNCLHSIPYSIWDILIGWWLESKKWPVSATAMPLDSTSESERAWSSNVIILGSMHVSSRSADDVWTIASNILPTQIGIELDSRRINGNRKLNPINIPLPNSERLPKEPHAQKPSGETGTSIDLESGLESPTRTSVSPKGDEPRTLSPNRSANASAGANGNSRIPPGPFDGLSSCYEGCIRNPLRSIFRLPGYLLLGYISFMYMSFWYVLGIKAGKEFENGGILGNSIKGNKLYLIDGAVRNLLDVGTFCHPSILIGVSMLLLSLPRYWCQMVFYPVQIDWFGAMWCGVLQLPVLVMAAIFIWMQVLFATLNLIFMGLTNGLCSFLLLHGNSAVEAVTDQSTGQSSGEGMASSSSFGDNVVSLFSDVIFQTVLVWFILGVVWMNIGVRRNAFMSYNILKEINLQAEKNAIESNSTRKRTQRKQNYLAIVGAAHIRGMKTIFDAPGSFMDEVEMK